MTATNSYRIVKDCRVGQVQAYAAAPDGISVNFSVFAGVQHRPSNTAYTSHCINMTAADARDLAETLLAAAAHAESVALVADEVAS